MTPSRALNADRLNEVLNHPAVRPWIADGFDRVDLSKAVADQRNVLLMGEHGGLMFFWLQPGIYELHTQVLPEGRGKWIDEFGNQCLHWMFTRTPAFEILTRVPRGHLAARAAALGHGFVAEFTRPRECNFRGRLVDVTIYSLTLMRWIAREHLFLEDKGRRFHDLLHAAADRHGIDAPAHDDDPNHNIYVGAALEMALGGQPEKAVLFYNRWAVPSRHEPIRLLGRMPIEIAIDHGLRVKIDTGQIEVEHAAA